MGPLVRLDALSGLANVASVAPKLVFHTMFGLGVSIAAAEAGGSASQSFEDVTGTDSITGYSFDSGSLYDFYGAGVYPHIQAIYDSPMYANGGATHPYYNECFANSINSSTTLSSVAGARELVLQCLDRTNPVIEVDPQTVLTFARSRVGGIALDDIPEIFYSFDFILQSDLITQMSDTNYSLTNFLTLTEMKTGDKDATAGRSWGDCRFKVEIRRNTTVNGTKLYFHTALDDNANGLTHIPSCPGPSVTTYQQVTHTANDADGNDICPVNVPLRVKVHIKRPQMIWVRSGAGTTSDAYNKDTATGITKVDIVNLNTERSTTIAEFIGGVQSGNENLPWQRHLVCNAYSRALTPYEHRITNLRIWNKPNEI